MSNPDGVLFDSSAVDRINRSFGPALFNSTNWTLLNGTQSMNVALQWVTVKDAVDAEDLIFSDGFDGG